MLLSRLKLVCRMADVHLGRVSVVHLKRNRDSWGKIVKNQNKQKKYRETFVSVNYKNDETIEIKMFLL